MGRNARLGIFLSLLGVVAGLVIFTGMAFVRTAPPVLDFVSGHRAGQPVDLHLQTVGALGYGPHPTWVSYLTQAPDGSWVHTTEWNLPANTLIDVTLDQYDSGSPLRNPAIGLVTGVRGGAMRVNGKAVRLVDSYAGNGVAHTFTIPALGVSVPLVGVDGNAKNFCSTPAPCGSALHNTITFSFRTPGPGQYRWQCFVPCGLGYLYGNGGPMSTAGYMGGFLKVIA